MHFPQDFEGQARAESLSRIIVMLFGAVGLIWGYVIQQFSQTVYILAAGLALATLVSRNEDFSTWFVSIKPFSFQLTVPPWPFYRHKPLKWQPARAVNQESASSKAKKSK